MGNEIILRNIGKELAAILSGDERPSPKEFERLLRELAAREGCNVLSLLVETLDQHGRRVIEDVTVNSFCACDRLLDARRGLA